MKLSLHLAAAAALAHQAFAGMCSAVSPYSWTQAASANPQLQGALQVLSKYAVASWYTDRGYGDDIDKLLANCDSSDTLSIVIYGLPNKDCGDGFSSGGSNKDASTYKSWVQSLVSRVGSRNVVYVLEPDAVALLANNNCAKQNNYLANLKTALSIISAGNPNAKIYADVASWADLTQAASILNDLKSAGRLNGITINTSNYKSNAQLLPICQTLSAATGGLHCTFDTSRNYRGSTGDEWCNSKTAGIGAPPGSDTGSPLVDYNLWLKVPGESDGQCSGRTSDAMAGPNAGDFFADGFTSLWNNGYFVDKAGLPKIGSGNTGSWTVAPTTSSTPSTSNAPTTASPTTASPTTTSTTNAPTTTSADITTEAPSTTETPSAANSTTYNSTSTEVPASTSASPSSSGDSSSSTSLETVSTTPSTDTPTPSTTLPIAQNDVSVQASGGAQTDMSTGTIVLIAMVAVAGVVAAVLAVAVVRKRNMDEKRDDYIERDSRGIVILGVTPMHDSDRAIL
ncbi:unnamed protein product [Aphanomyces euteiches]